MESTDYTIGETRVERDAYKKLSAETIIALPEAEGRRLEISTSRGDRGLVTRASVYHVKGGMRTFIIGGDFFKTIVHSGARGTEPAIRAQHSVAIRQIPQIVAEARAHYANTVEGQRADRLREQRAA